MAVPTDSPEGEFCEAELLKNISWTRTPKGETAKKPCPFGFSGEVDELSGSAGSDHPGVCSSISTRGIADFSSRSQRILWLQGSHLNTAGTVVPKRKKGRGSE